MTTQRFWYPAFDGNCSIVQERHSTLAEADVNVIEEVGAEEPEPRSPDSQVCPAREESTIGVHEDVTGHLPSVFENVVGTR